MITWSCRGERTSGKDSINGVAIPFCSSVACLASAESQAPSVGHVLGTVLLPILKTMLPPVPIGYIVARKKKLLKCNTGQDILRDTQHSSTVLDSFRQKEQLAVEVAARAVSAAEDLSGGREFVAVSVYSSNNC